MLKDCRKLSMPRQNNLSNAGSYSYMYLLFYKQMMVLHWKTNELEQRDRTAIIWEHSSTEISEIQKFILKKKR